jgi:hypothetical protein
MKSLLSTFSCLSWLLLAAPALSATINLAPNGDFELGNAQFGSGYAFSPSTNFTEAQYTVRTNPFPWNPLFISAGDHTSGSGNMFVGNGAPRDQIVWSSSAISVTANTDYFFEAWVMNVCCNPALGQPNPTQAINPAVLSFYANGVLLGTPNMNSLGIWEGLSTTWNSGSSTQVTLELRNANLGALGNDFAVDDVFLGTQTSIGTVPEPSMIFGSAIALGFGTMLKRNRGGRGNRLSKSE